MTRQIAVLGAPSSLGMRPYDDGEARHLDWAPRILRDRDLVQRIRAVDFGDITPPRYCDFVRPRGRPRNEHEILVYSRSIGEQVARATDGRRFTVVLGGDCSIALGCLVGARQPAHADIGLVYVDAHPDFAMPDESRTGSAAGMCLGLAIGRGRTPLARLTGRRPIVDGRHAIHIGRRTSTPAWLGHEALGASAILEVPSAALMTMTPEDLATTSFARVAGPEVVGFWVHLDVDVFNPAVMPAVDSPELGGPLADELVARLSPIVNHPQALGLDVTVYDPALDPDRSCARRLVKFLEALLVGAEVETPRNGSARVG